MCRFDRRSLSAKAIVENGVTTAVTASARVNIYKFMSTHDTLLRSVASCGGSPSLIR